MKVLKTETLPIREEGDVVRVRHRARSLAAELAFSVVDQTKLVTAASELARNTLVHGGGGEVAIDLVVNGDRKGVKLTFEDQGPGIPNIEVALRDGYTTGGGMGLGLGGAKRLVNDFEISSRTGQGTKVVITRWKQ